MKKIILSLMFALGAVLMVCCSSPVPKGPETVAEKAVAALHKGDYDAYAATFDLSESDQKMLAGMVEEKVSEKIAEKGGIKSYKVTDTAIDEDKAKVTVHLVYKDGTEDDQDMAFSKGEDGAWKQEIVGK